MREPVSGAEAIYVHALAAQRVRAIRLAQRDLKTKARIHDQAFREMADFGKALYTDHNAGLVEWGEMLARQVLAGESVPKVQVLLDKDDYLYRPLPGDVAVPEPGNPTFPVPTPVVVPVVPVVTPEPAPTPKPEKKPAPAKKVAKKKEPKKEPAPAKTPEPKPAPVKQPAPKVVEKPEPAKPFEPFKAPEPAPRPELTNVVQRPRSNDFTFGQPAKPFEPAKPPVKAKE